MEYKLFDGKYSRWITDIEDVWYYLDVMFDVQGIMVEAGFDDVQCRAFEGVQERDTGYWSFAAQYDSFLDMYKKLGYDFLKCETEHLNECFGFINFGEMLVDFQRGESRVRVTAKENRLILEVLEGAEPEKIAEELDPALSEIWERCK